MSAKTKQKYVYQEHLENFDPPSANQLVARITQSRGSNLMEVLDANGQVYLVSLPAKFRKNIWLRRGSFVVLERISEGRKVRAEVVRVLAERQISELRLSGHWPLSFSEDPTGKPRQQNDALRDAEFKDGGSLNRPPMAVEESSDSDESTSDCNEQTCDGDSDCSVDNACAAEACNSEIEVLTSKLRKEKLDGTGT